MGRRTDGVVTDARRRAAQVHAGRKHTCVCGKVVFGNGGQSSHQKACRVFQATLLGYYKEAEVQYAEHAEKIQRYGGEVTPSRLAMRESNLNRLRRQEALMANWPEGAKRPKDAR